MSLLDIIGPVMVGPSSSHTAGAVRLGWLARQCWGEPPQEVDLFLRGSFAATYWGHGTDRALAAGLQGLSPDDPRVPEALDLARDSGLAFRFHGEVIDEAHPYPVRFHFIGQDREMEIVGASIGGGSVRIQSLDGFCLNLSGELESLVTFHRDLPGVVAAVAGELARLGVNIATMNLHRGGRGERAAMVIELDKRIDGSIVDDLRSVHPALERVFLIPAGGDVR
ncbi:MAG: L-serine ammonia-lyase, iron-sulfur-dependent subunit beta [Synergistales bacterium]|nr:L-serine ammonia-lyase, iron-sulfur-dependent subunit beta [Synergistales bacterium]